MDIPGELPQHCYGLIECTPIPTLVPTGLTPQEVQAMGVAFGTFFSVWGLLMLFLIAITFTAIVYAATAHRN